MVDRIKEAFLLKLNALVRRLLFYLRLNPRNCQFPAFLRPVNAKAISNVQAIHVLYVCYTRAIRTRHTNSTCLAIRVCFMALYLRLAISVWDYYKTPCFGAFYEIFSSITLPFISCFVSSARFNPDVCYGLSSLFKVWRGLFLAVYKGAIALRSNKQSLQCYNNWDYPNFPINTLYVYYIKFYCINLVNWV